MRTYIVYIHKNKTNGMRYVGITSQTAEQRWASGYGYQKQSHFWRAICKYGWDGFDHEIVAEGITKKEAAQLEIFLINKYNTTDKNHGYNKSTGGEAGAKGVPRSEKNKAAVIESVKLRWQDPEFRKRETARLMLVSQTPEARAKRAASRKGLPVSESTRRKISEAKKGVKLKPFSEEHKRKIREHHAGGAPNSPVFCCELNETYKSINDAARATGINKKQISGCCHKRPHYNTAGGYHWQFV